MEQIHITYTLYTKQKINSLFQVDCTTAPDTLFQAGGGPTVNIIIIIYN